MLYDSKTIKFDLIIHDVINEERYIFTIKKSDIVILTHRNNKNKQFIKNDFDDFNSSSIAKFIFLIKPLIANSSILLLNVKLNSFI